MKLLQIILPHQPDEPVAGIAPDDRAHGVERVAGMQFPLDRTRPDRRTPRHLIRRGEPRGKGGHVAGPVLQRVSGRHQPPDFVEVERADRVQRDAAVAAMGGIERPAEQADLHP